MRVFLVEDDNEFADALSTTLRRHGHDVLRADSGERALAGPGPAGMGVPGGAGGTGIDIVLLDLGLPDMDGLDVLRRLRERSQVGVIAVTARGEERQRVLGLRNGADDYLVKPFGMAELAARMEAVLRRLRPTPMTGPVVLPGPVEIDLARRTVTRDAESVNLTRKEFDLLSVLVRADGAVLSRERLLAEVWQTTWQGVGRTLEVHVANLRAKLGSPQLIKTVHGVGYRLGAQPSDLTPAGGP